MKKVTTVLFILIFLLSGGMLFSQEEAEVPEVPEVETPAAEEVSEEEKPRAGAGVFEMGEIVVRDRALASVEDASTTTEITAEDIRARGDKTLADSLSMVPGVKINASAKGTMRLNMRGFDQDRVVLLIDGIPVGDPYESSFDLSQIPAANVSKIVVNRGASSALYGAHGAVGSINVITQRPEEEFTQVNFEFGQYNNHSMSASHGGLMGDDAYYWITSSIMHSGGYNVSSKLDYDERRKWFDKLVRYDLYETAGGDPVTFEDLDLHSVENYLNDKGLWNHTGYTKYQLAGKFGYAIADNMEAGLSASYFYNQQDSNTFRNNMFSSYDPEDAASGDGWSHPDEFNWEDPGRGSWKIFQNRVFSWPEKYDILISPYFTGEFGDFSIRTNIFYYKQMTDLLGYASQDYSKWMFGGGGQFAHSIWTEQSIGINIFPSYDVADWNRLNFAVLYREDSHIAETKPQNFVPYEDGSGTVKDRSLAVDYITFAVEDEMKLMDTIEIAVGISYDAQRFKKHKEEDGGTLVNQDRAKGDSMLWGTRDSFNPVVAGTWQAMEDLLKLRAAFSSKTKFPTLSAYRRDIDREDDFKPERSYNANAGFELTPLGDILNLRIDYFYSRFNDKLESVYDPDIGDNVYTNIDGVESQGVEAIVSVHLARVQNIVDINSTLAYTYVNVKNLSDFEDSGINKGKRMEGTPVHTIQADLRFDFITDTSLNIFGYHTRNQIAYAMKERPDPADDFSTKYFKTVKLHNPYMFNFKLSQRVGGNREFYVMCRNIFDDYDADPFNPGPGRMYYFGGSVEF